MAEDHTEVALSIADLFSKVHSQVHHLIARIFEERSTYASFTGRPIPVHALIHTTSPKQHSVNSELPFVFMKLAFND
jgi:hypothetical protein